MVDYGGDKTKHHHGRDKTQRAIYEWKTLIFVQPTTTDSQSACNKKTTMEEQQRKSAMAAVKKLDMKDMLITCKINQGYYLLDCVQHRQLITWNWRQQGGSIGTALLMLILGARWEWMVNTMPQPIYPSTQSAQGWWVDLGAGLDRYGKILPPTSQPVTKYERI